MLKTNNVILVNNTVDIYKYFKEIGKEVGNTTELNNVVLSYQEVQNPAGELPTETDKGERNWLWDNIDFAIKKISKDKNTRQAIIYNTHDSGLEHNCLNLFQLYFREDKLHLNVYVRSMNFDDNFEHDLYTFNILLNEACNKLMLDKGHIVVFIMSLHRFKHEVEKTIIEKINEDRRQQKLF
jgi:thymidylate synthase